jgi:hypothetical protein
MGSGWTEDPRFNIRPSVDVLCCVYKVLVNVGSFQFAAIHLERNIHCQEAVNFGISLHLAQNSVTNTRTVKLAIWRLLIARGIDPVNAAL